MSKAKKITYWVVTLWMSLGMVSTGIVQILNVEGETEFILNLGYPVYFLTIIGIWKILGTVAVLIPGFLILKEWAYAGFFFLMSGAIFSHIGAGQAGEMFPALLLLALTVASWYLRPAERKLTMANAPDALATN